MIELIIVVTITPLIVGALAAGLIAMFSLQSGVSSRLSDSADAQVVSTNFAKDVETASMVTTSPTLGVCGVAGQWQLLGIQVDNDTSGTNVVTYISYVEQLQSGSTWSLVRNTCSSVSPVTDLSAETVSYDVLAPLPVSTPLNPSPTSCTPTSPPTCLAPPTVYDGTTVLSTGSTWVSTQGVTNVQFPIYEASSKYSYTLQAQPATGTSTDLSDLGAPTTGPSCGFALPGTGTFASTLCFIDFSILNTTDSTGHTVLSDAEGRTTCSSTGKSGYQMSVAVPGGYTMSFCLLITPGGSDVLRAVEIPISGPQNCSDTNDGGCISNGRGFLGNAQANPSGVISPFYSGIGCADNTPTSYFLTDGSGASVMQGTLSCIDPAIFQETNGGTDTVSLSNIVVTDPEGTNATGYEVVTADAETTDPGGSITWTSTPTTGSPDDFNVLPNSSTSDLGDACNTVPSADTSAPNEYTAAAQDIDDGDQTVTIGSTPYSGSLVGGIGTDSVVCTSNWQTEIDKSTNPWTYWDRTGTAMLGVSPTSTTTVVGGVSTTTTPAVAISAKLKGEGFNAVAFGLLLP